MRIETLEPVEPGDPVAAITVNEKELRVIRLVLGAITITSIVDSDYHREGDSQTVHTLYTGINGHFDNAGLGK